VRHNAKNYVGIINDLEKEAPPYSDPPLPNIVGLINLLGLNGRIPKISGQQASLLVKALCTAKGASL
jgi:hypothetical protein